MARPAPAANDQASIAAAISAMAARLAAGGRTSAKFPLIKQILREAVAQAPVDTQLPAMREIASRLHTTLVPAQRAVTELIAEGVLHSRPRAGVYVGRRPPVPAAATPPTAGAPAAAPARRPLAPFHSEFTFATDSAWPFQQAFWNDLATGYQQSYPRTQPVFHFAPDTQPHQQPVDAFERSAWRDHWLDWRQYTLPVRPFLAEAPPVPLLDDRLLTLYYRTYFVFCNTALLARHALPAPGYRDFAGQTAYFRAQAPRLATAGLDPRPRSVQEPVTLGGRWLDRFLALADPAQEPAPAAVAELGEAMDRLVTFCGLCSYYGGPETQPKVDVDEHEADFRAGRTPFYFGYSVDYWTLLNVPPTFPWTIYPTLCADDGVFH